MGWAGMETTLAQVRAFSTKNCAFTSSAMHAIVLANNAQKMLHPKEKGEDLIG
jgi:hypothetical protein